MTQADGGSTAISPLERETIARVTRRVLPLLALCYFAAYLDRVNVGFAALTMNRTLGLSPAAYGLGSGIFFLGYFVFEVPSNMLLAKFGARLWITRIMVVWGITSALTACISGPLSFCGVRFALGVAEAGFFPGIILYLTWWFPSRYRSRAVAMFMAAIPVANALGSLLSGALLDLDGWLGLAGWQWLFLLEGLPAVGLGVVVCCCLTDRPRDATWLLPAQRQWLTERLALERRQREQIRRFTLLEALMNRRVLLLSLVYFGGSFAGYAIALFQPQIVHRLAGGYFRTGWVNAIPYLFAVVATLSWGRLADQQGGRSRHVAASYLVAAAGMIATALMTDPVLTMTMLVVAAMGQTSAFPLFWALPTAMLSGTAAAGGIALINALGSLGGFFGPTLFGLIRGATSSDTLGLLVVAIGPIMSAVIVILLGQSGRARSGERGASPRRSSL